MPNDIRVKNYTSLYQIKDTLVNKVAPKYLNMDEMNLSSTGLFGYITEVLATIGEDGLNVTSMVFKECFANAAENPESLYLMAAIYQLDDLFAKAATMPFVLLVAEDDIIARGRANNNFTEFGIDRRTISKIDNRVFSLEYDVLINTKKTKNGYVHAVKYNIDHKKTISKVSSQFIQSKVFRYEGKNYVAMAVNLRQYEFEEHNETIISNDKINVCSFDFDIGTESQIAGFEAFYTPPGGVEVQLSKRLENTSKITEPFCYYTLPAEGALRISFANDDRYFIPEFNSQLRVEIYKTSGTDGNFSKYKGDDINIEPVSDKYSEDNALILLGQVSSSSVGGKNKMTTDELRDAVIAAQSTVKVYNTASDLQLYFKKMVNASNTRIMFMKRRDDALIRLFNAFLLLINNDNKIIPTNTVDTIIEHEDIDAEYPETFRSIVRAGKLYTYNPMVPGFMKIVRDVKITDNLDGYEADFLYANPFLTVLSSSPVNVGLYLNSVQDDLKLDANEVNGNSFVQFMTSGLSIKRNAMAGEMDYQLDITLVPTSVTTVTDCITEIKDDMRVPEGVRRFVNPDDGKEYIDNQLIKVILCLEDKTIETCYVEFELYAYDKSNQSFRFRTKITTDDYVSTNSKVKFINTVYDLDKAKPYPEKFVPCKDVIGNIYTFFKYTDGTTNEPHHFTGKHIAEGYTFTNKYTTTSEPINFIIPLDSINAYMKYNRYAKDDGTMDYNFKVCSLPMVKANYIKDTERFREFLDIFNGINKYLNDEIDLLTNNFDIDIKFFNTYGKSKNYVVAENARLDKVNIKLKFEVKPYYTTDTETLVEDIKEFILDYVRGEFDSTGNNSIYISNLIRKLEVHFADKLEYIIYRGINDYDLSVQKLEPDVNDDNIATFYSSMEDYVPEYINVDYLIKDNELSPQISIVTI